MQAYTIIISSCTIYSSNESLDYISGNNTQTDSVNNNLITWSVWRIEEIWGVCRRS